MTTTNQPIIGNSLAGLGYVFLSFCSFTDGVVTDEEVEAIRKEISGISAAWEFTDEQRHEAIDDAVTMLDGCPTAAEKVELFCKILDALKNQEWWNQATSEAAVGSLTRMMDADGEQHENEIYWINKLKTCWDVA
jgi:hypothetical protein